MKKNPFKIFVDAIKKIRSRPPSKKVIDRINDRVRKEETKIDRSLGFPREIKE